MRKDGKLVKQIVLLYYITFKLYIKEINKYEINK
jgi:hypothetical protein